MQTVRSTPGPDAARAFRTGILVAAVIGLTAIAALYWLGAFTALFAGYVTVVLFPVYLIFTAAVLSVWLGYDKGPTSLRPVYQHQESAESRK